MRAHDVAARVDAFSLLSMGGTIYCLLMAYQSVKQPNEHRLFPFPAPLLTHCLNLAWTIDDDCGVVLLLGGFMA